MYVYGIDRCIKKGRPKTNKPQKDIETGDDVLFAINIIISISAIHA